MSYDGVVGDLPLTTRDIGRGRQYKVKEWPIRLNILDDRKRKGFEVVEHASGRAWAIVESNHANSRLKAGEL